MDTVKPTVLLDCDPGHDDTIAILAASQLTNLVGITTVAGNAPLAMTTHNAQAVCDRFGIDVSVHAGADRPLLVAPHHAPDIHGPTGLGGTNLPDPNRTIDSTMAASFIIDASHQHSDLWLVPVGPLTNIALALRMDPSLADRIAGISVMGGGIEFGNVTPMAEFNLFFDPHAAKIVFDSGIPLQMCGLDLTHQVMVTPEDAAGFRGVATALNAGSPPQNDGSTGGDGKADPTLHADRAGFVADVITYFAQRYQAVTGGEELGPMHDPCAVIAITNPELFTSEMLEVRVETEGANRGMTAADLRGFPGRATPNVLVHRQANATEIRRVMFEAVTKAIHA